MVTVLYCSFCDVRTIKMKKKKQRKKKQWGYC